MGTKNPTPEHRLKISKALTGIKRKPFTAEHREKLSLAKKGIVLGKKAPLWKGNKASYRAIHQWVVRWFGKPTTCEICKTENLSGHFIHWANKTGKYLRKRSDWERICAKCHRKKYKDLNHNSKRFFKKQ